MNTKKTLTFFLFAFVLLPFIAAGSERYCFIDNFGISYDFKGGKAGKKAFLVEASFSFSPTPLTGIATFAKVDGGYQIMAFISRDSAGNGSSFQLALFADTDLLTATGNYDNLPRSFPPDGAITLTQIACPGPLSRFRIGTPHRANSGPGSKEEQ